MLKHIALTALGICVFFQGLAAPVEDTQIAAPDARRFGPLLALQKVEGPGSGTGIILRGSQLYVLGDSALWIYDTADPLRPKLTGKLSGIYEGRQIALTGTTACIAARGHGLYLIDVSNPRKPRLLSRTDTIELATGIEAAGKLVFVALRQYGIECFDISNPEHPRHLSLTPTPEAQSAVYRSGRLYVGNWAPARLTVLDVSNPYAPKEVVSHPLSGFGDGMAVRGTLCAAATGHHAKTGPVKERQNNGHSVNLIDIGNPAKPKTLSVFRFPAFFGRGNDFWTVRLSGNTAIVADSHNGVFLVNISNPSKPEGAGQIQLPGRPSPAGGSRPDAVSGIAAGNGVVYLTGVRSGLFLVSAPGIKPEAAEQGELPEVPPEPATNRKEIPGFFRYDAGGQVRAVAVHGDNAWIAASDAGIHQVKLSENGIRRIAVHPVPAVYDVKFSDGLLYTAEAENGIAVYRPGKDGSLTLLGRGAMPRGVLAQFIWKPEGAKFAVVSGRGGMLYFFDVSNPASIREVFRHHQIGALYGDLLCDKLFDGRYVVNNWHSGGLAWYDLSGTKPVLSRSISERLNTFHDGLAKLNGKLLMINLGKYVLLEPNQPGPAKNWKRFSAPERLRGFPTVDGTTVALSDRILFSVRLFDFSNPESPRLIRERCWKFPEPCGTVSFWNGRTVIPLSYGGLLLEKKTPEPAAQKKTLIFERLQADLLSRQAADAEYMEHLIRTQKEDGSWDDIDYQNRNSSIWTTSHHLNRLFLLAQALAKPEHPLSHSRAAGDAVRKAARFWGSRRFQSPNWWWNEIAVPELTADTMFAAPELFLNQPEREMMLNVMRQAQFGGTGQNRLWKAGNVLKRAVLENNDALIRRAVQEICAELQVSDREGIRADGSFQQHGAQLQFGNYGLSFLSRTTFWNRILAGTPYAFTPEHLNILRSLVLNGYRWILWNGSFDLLAQGRQLGRGSQTRKADEALRSIAALRKADPVFDAEYARIFNTERPFTGNRNFWNSDYMVHRRPGWFASLRMNSVRTVPAEDRINWDNALGRYLSDGVLLLMRRGDEYRDIAACWDWTRLPGTTLPATPVLNETECRALGLKDSSGHPPRWSLSRKWRFHGESEFTGGVSDGTRGAAVYSQNVDGVKAKKAVFFDLDAIWLLGAEITSESPYEVATTVNSLLRRGEILQGKNWVHHDGTGYRGENLAVLTGKRTGDWCYIEGGTAKPTTQTQDLFQLRIPHGVKPSNASYAAVILSGATPEETKEWDRGKIILNSGNCQAVEFSDGMTAAVFHAPGKLGTFETRQPGVFLITENKITAADPTGKLREITIILNGIEKRIVFPSGAMAGSSVQIPFYCTGHR